jgi:hypothetical protein
MNKKGARNVNYRPLLVMPDATVYIIWPWLMIRAKNSKSDHSGLFGLFLAENYEPTSLQMSVEKRMKFRVPQPNAFRVIKYYGVA